MTGTVEQEVALGLAGTRERREQQRDRVAELCGQIDWTAFMTLLEQSGATALLGGRLLETPGLEPPQHVVERVAAVHAQNRLRATLVEAESVRLWRTLEDAGIAALLLKGPMMATELYGDAALRPSNDVDLLVAPDRFAEAVELLTSEGYVAAKGITWERGLPLFETTLVSRDAWRPPVDLHWRIHWYEAASSATLLNAPRPPDGSPRRLGGREQFAALLVFFCRDGLRGLRGISDIAAAWDTHRGELDHGGLEVLADGHEPLRPAFAAAITAAERLAGVPAERILPSARNVSRGAERATRLASAAGDTAASADQARVALIDVLLAPPGGRVQSVRRHVLPPADAINRIYDVPPDAVMRRAIARARFAVLVGVGILPHLARALWDTRAHRALVPPTL